MDTQNHSLSALFDQLGLDSSETGIRSFINKNAILKGDAKLHEANFWNSAQADFLKQAKDEDADWAEIVDQLDLTLRP
ncbi:conserved hypothetical protein [Psychromonas ingrahamii 37]|uniref:DUF2789 domain-containing protein n=1 Tax=Psychromonas ingrahamii (strain DSM 17664 / CCUG 51855 / 37) TaxID=357804 RepID=A1SWX3_PSYIN|nr:DUF2789 domain-containing protein [Psychromonas ingrahamii]ABM03988.1 conserved hypothetical protein [Psychromonas ingrahamii 37]